MKKKIALTLAAVMLMTAGVAMAADIETSGDLKLHYRWETKDGVANTEGGKVWFRLNAKTALSDNVDAYARLAIQKLNGDLIGADFDNTYDQYSRTGATSLDRFGVIVKNNGWNYTVGRQDLFLGGGMLADNTGYMGINLWAVDGITATGKAGVTDLKVVAAQEWKSGSDDSKIYAIQGSYSPAKDWTLGAVYAKTDKETEKDLNHYAVNASYALGKAGLFAEYGKSSADTNDKGYAFGTSYKFDSKISGYAIYSNVESNVPVIAGDITTFDAGGKGMYYGVDYKLDANKTFSVFYKDMTKIGSTTDYSSLRTTLTFAF